MYMCTANCTVHINRLLVVILSAVSSAVCAGLGLTKAIALAASHSNTSGWGSLVSWPGRCLVIFLGLWIP